MKLVMTLVVRGEADILDAQIAYHLNAGVDVVIATDRQPTDGTSAVLKAYARDGYLHVIGQQGESRESEWRTHMARLAATDYDADWVFDSDADEFWWPRAENLKDVLVAIPERYTVVQALVRRFLPPLDPGQFFAERMTIRDALHSPRGEKSNALAHALRPVYRADPRLVVVPRGVLVEAWRVPLRAWYPIEVFQLPSPARNGSAALDDALVVAGLADGSLVSDIRLSEALSRLRAEADGSAHRFALPVDGVSRLQFEVPDVVDDAEYAVECAALGEVDFGPLERHIEDLERRMAVLEARFWPQVARRLARLGRRRR